MDSQMAVDLACKRRGVSAVKVIQSKENNVLTRSRVAQQEPGFNMQASPTVVNRHCMKCIIIRRASYPLEQVGVINGISLKWLFSFSQIKKKNKLKHSLSPVHTVN